MAKYRVLAELTQLYEVEIEAENANEARAIAEKLDNYDFTPWDDTGLSDGFEIVSTERVTS